ncbi:ATP-binding protein [Vibrio coralliilyticus]|uniref:ATP-binding protein n=1 Tax=Vibrio coralliilyticus TaxID=190893 RepID=UPI0005126FCC|nr:ATP-binding protein [Vibrio coralliilyticus]AIU67251.1 hypothetical protein JV59_33720 [Vibrio coralliilyticus]
MPKIIFVAGVHGVGKSTLCRKLSEKFGWPHYSCSDLIKQNSDYVESSKFVSEPDKNQQALLSGISKITDATILLDGHFCLLDSEKKVINLSFNFFDEILPIAILHVTCLETEILLRLSKRDDTSMTLKLIEMLQSEESKRVRDYVSHREGCELYHYQSPDYTTGIVYELGKYRSEDSVE